VTPVTRELPRVIYITSLGHSGSTLLDLLISAHPEVVSTGEAKNLVPTRTPKIRCPCPGHYLVNCPYWKRFGALLAERHGLRLEELDLMSEDRAVFERQNAAFFEIAAELSGKRIIVDSSKNVVRLRRLVDIPTLRVDVVQLSRRPHGVVYSQVKKGRHWISASLSYSRRIRRAREVLGEIDHTRVRYEELAEDPRRVLGELMPRFGLAFDPAQLDWAGRERHDCGGNRMRRSESSTIRLDRSWERELGPWRKAAISVLTARARH